MPRFLEWWEREEQSRLSLEASGLDDDLPEEDAAYESAKGDRDARWRAGMYESDEYDPNSGSETQKDWRPEDLR